MGHQSAFTDLIQLKTTERIDERERERKEELVDRYVASWFLLQIKKMKKKL